MIISNIYKVTSQFTIERVKDSYFTDCLQSFKGISYISVVNLIHKSIEIEIKEL